MKALVLDAERGRALVEDVPIPQISPPEVLVEVKAVALNPIDALYTQHPLGRTGRVTGSDFSGVVVDIGSAVPTSSDTQIGTRVAGFLQGHSSINDRPGAFAEFLATPWDLVWCIKDLTFEEAASVSLAALTSAQTLFYRLRLAAPFSWTATAPDPQTTQPRDIFINGAATSVGLYAAQLARASPEPVVVYGSASPRHFAWLSEEPYRYDRLIDYHTEGWQKQVISWTQGSGVDLGFDCISEGSTVLQTAETLKSSSTSNLAVVRSRAGKAWDTPNDELGIEPVYGAVWEGLGEHVEYVGMTLPPNPEARAFTVAFYSWLSEGVRLVPNPVRLMPGGWKKSQKTDSLCSAPGKWG